MNEPSNSSLFSKFLTKTASILLYPTTRLSKFINARRTNDGPQEQGNGRRRPTPKPVFLPRRRQGRSLTLNSSPSHRHVAKQPSTALFLLPPEIRNMIWENLLCGKTIHWWIEDKKLRGFVCNSTEAVDRECFLNCWILAFESENPHKLGVMGLLQSCRKFYSETIDLLYSNNTFSSSSTTVLAYLPNLILPRRINSIRTLRLTWLLGEPPSTPKFRRHIGYGNFLEIEGGPNQTGDHYREVWFQIWKNLAEMEGLAELTVDLNIIGGSVMQWTSKELDVVKDVRRPQRLVLVIPQVLLERMVGTVGGANCEVISAFQESESEDEDW